MWQIEEYNSTGFQLPDPLAKSLSPVLDVLQAMGTENIVE
jgi:diphthamide synthase subunit DPH2